jgi:hypothetical protein
VTLNRLPDSHLAADVVGRTGPCRHESQRRDHHLVSHDRVQPLLGITHYTCVSGLLHRMFPALYQLGWINNLYGTASSVSSCVRSEVGLSTACTICAGVQHQLLHVLLRTVHWHCRCGNMHAPGQLGVVINATKYSACAYPAVNPATCSAGMQYSAGEPTGCLHNEIGHGLTNSTAMVSWILRSLDIGTVTLLYTLLAVTSHSVTCFTCPAYNITASGSLHPLRL